MPGGVNFNVFNFPQLFGLAFLEMQVMLFGGEVTFFKMQVAA